MAKKFNLSRTLTRPKNPEDIVRTMSLMRAIREAGSKQPSAQSDIPAQVNETPSSIVLTEPQP